MKKSVILWLVLFLSISFSSLAQEQKDGNNEKKKDGREAFEKWRKEFITEKVGLTAEEAKAFWPIYDNLSQLRWNYHHERRRSFMNLQEKVESNTVTEEDYKKANDDRVNIELKSAATEKEFYKKLEAVLSAEKISKLYAAEMDFNNELLKKVEQRGGEKKKDERRSEITKPPIRY